MASTKLAVIWSSGDPEVAHKVCFMYTHNAKRRGWFDDVTLVVWGPSAEILTRAPTLQDAIKAMIADGVVVEVGGARDVVAELLTQPWGAIADVERGAEW